MKLQIENDAYPNGTPFKRVYESKRLGIYTEVEGGFLPAGKRKPRKTEFDAILAVIADRQAEVERQAAWLETARDEAFKRQNEFGANQP